MIRIQKWLADLGLASRREAEKWIAEGKVKVNGKVLTEMGLKIDPDRDHVLVEGRMVAGANPPKVYWVLNKPDKTLTSRSGAPGQKTIYDLPCFRGLKFHVFPVGRLDYRTEGLLLMTNDGDVCYRLSHPKFHVPRVYQVLIDGRLAPEKVKQIRQGALELEDGMVKAEVRFVHGQKLPLSVARETDKGSWYFVTVHEGRNRLVRRMFEACGHRVLRLMRTGFGDLSLDDQVQSGAYRQLNGKEVAYLKYLSELEPVKREIAKSVTSGTRAAESPVAEKRRAKQNPLRKPRNADAAARKADR